MLRQHPVELLHARAERQFLDLVSRQSTTPEEAAIHYTARYGRAPPPGYDKWVEYALAYGSPIIDDFDILYEGLDPFYSMSAQHIRGLTHRTMQLSQETDKGIFGICTFVDGEFTQGTNCKESWAGEMMMVLGDAALQVPNVDLFINFLDEPSVLPTALDDSSALTVINRDHRPLGKFVTAACNRVGRRILRTKNRDERIPTLGLPFVLDVDDEKDVCLHPSYTDMHGIFLSPDTFRHIPVRVPMLTAGAPHPFSDIIFPSPQYTWKKNRYNPKTDKTWEEKENSVYWTGRTTGGHATADEASWRSSHRQRLVTMIRNEHTHNFTYLDKKFGLYRRHQSTSLNKTLYNVRLTATVQCDLEVCGLEEEAFAPMYEDEWSAPFNYRILIDIDGNAYANRFYRLLGTDSVPLKISIFREWHDDRLVPWLHYIPVSQSMEELPELVNFLVKTEEGQKISRRVAKAGQSWSEKSLNMVQQGIYLYRLMLEMAWLMNETRPVEWEDAPYS
ncbi:hypothetical protein GQ53DRAFT_781659 [Thozetella sp. PMI_491]|nr:hypothetical protein GQ53DRAFT_781659 [Thozetella sp. PMI_491]